MAGIRMRDASRILTTGLTQFSSSDVRLLECSKEAFLNVLMHKVYHDSFGLMFYNAQESI